MPEADGGRIDATWPNRPIYGTREGPCPPCRSLFECIRDTAGGFSTDRPGLRQVRRLLNEPRVDVVLAHPPDRFSRCQDQFHQLLAELEQAGASREFVVDGTPPA